MEHIEEIKNNNDKIKAKKQVGYKAFLPIIFVKLRSEVLWTFLIIFCGSVIILIHEIK